MAFTATVTSAPYNCPTNGTSDCRAAFLAVRDAAIAAGGLAAITIPAGTYKFKLNGGSNADNDIFGGITSLIVEGTGATLTDDAGVGGFRLGAGNATGGVPAGPAYTTSPKLATALAGATTLTCIATAADFFNASRTGAQNAALFTMGQYALITGFDLQGLWNSGYGEPPNPHWFEYVLVTNIVGATITISAPLRYSYLSTWPWYSRGANDGQDQGGPATLYVLPAAWNCSHEYRGLTISQTSDTNAIGRDIILRNCANAIGGGQVIPSVNSSIRYIDCTLPNFMEVDKLIGTVSFEGTTTTGQVQFQSSSTDLLNISGSVTMTQLNGTPKRVTASGATIGTLRPGANFYGRTDQLNFTDCVIRAVTEPGGQLEKGTGEVGVNIAWTKVGGLVTVPNTHGSCGWAVPGTWLTYTGQFYSETAFKVLSVTQDATNTYIQTSSPGGWPAVQTNVGGKLYLQVHPCPAANFVRCTGCPEVVDFSNAGAQGLPLYSYTKRSYNQTLTGLSSSPVMLWGNTTTIVIDVTQAYAGSTNPATLHFTSADNFPLFKSDYSKSLYGPTIDLRKLGTRTISRVNGVSNTGPANADANLPLTDVAVSWASGQYTPAVGAAYNDANWTATIEVIADQGIRRSMLCKFI